MLKNRTQKLTVGLSIIYLIGSWYAVYLLLRLNPSLSKPLQYLYTTIVAILFFIVWWLLASVNTLLSSYDKAIGSGQESKAFRALLQGTVLLFANLVLTAYISLFRLNPLATDYMPLTIGLYYSTGILAIAFCYQFGRSGYLFASLVRRRRSYAYAFGLILIGMALLSRVAWLNINSAGSQLASGNILNYLSSTVVLASLFIPLLIAWSLSLAGAYGLMLFQKDTQGRLYKRSMIWLTAGTVLLVVVSVARHLGGFILGEPSQATLIQDFPRVLVLLGLVILAVFCMVRGVKLLLKIEAKV